MRNALLRTATYSTVAIAFHWTIAAMIIVNLWLGLFHDGLPSEWKVMPVHKALGITVLVLTIGRIIWRLMHRPPPMLASVTGWERTAATLMHWALYALMLIMPLTGWAMSSVGRDGGPPRPLTWFFLFDIPYLPVNSAMAGIGHDLHGILGYLMTFLVVLHIAAALRHHFLLKDATLVRMIPALPEPSGSKIS